MLMSENVYKYIFIDRLRFKKKDLHPIQYLASNIAIRIFEDTHRQCQTHEEKKNHHRNCEIQ